MCMLIVNAPFTYTLGCFFSPQRKVRCTIKEVAGPSGAKDNLPRLPLWAVTILSPGLGPEALTVHSRWTLRVIIVCLFARSLTAYKKWLNLKMNFCGPYCSQGLWWHLRFLLPSKAMWINEFWGHVGVQGPYYHRGCVDLSGLHCHLW